MRKIINISLPEKIHLEVEKAIKQGNYTSKSDFFRELIGMWKKQKQSHFDAKKLSNLVKKHAVKGGPRDLSLKHDKYLYA